MRLNSLIAAIVLALPASWCAADTVFLSDGTEIEGTIVESSAKTVVIRQANGTVRSIRKSDVDTVVSSKSAKDSTNANSDSTTSTADAHKNEKKEESESDQSAARNSSDLPKESAPVKAASDPKTAENGTRKDAKTKDESNKGDARSTEGKDKEHSTAAADNHPKSDNEKSSSTHSHNHSGQGKH